MFMLENKTITIKVYKDWAIADCMGKKCSSYYDGEEEFYGALASLMASINNQLTYPLYKKGTKVRIKNAGGAFLNCANWVAFHAEDIPTRQLVYYQEGLMPTPTDCELEYTVDYADDGIAFISTYLKNTNSYKCFAISATGLDIIENEEDN